jgi:hypothetical protein
MNPMILHATNRGWPSRSYDKWLFENERGAADRPTACSRTSY